MKFWERFGIGVMSLWGLFAVHKGVDALVRAHNWQAMTISDWGTWVGSIGTVATLIGTIHLATTETRRRTHQEQLTAELQSVAIDIRLAHAEGCLAGSKTLLEHVVNEHVGLRQLYEFAMRQIVEIEEISIDAILPLATLPTNVASIVVRTAASLKGLRHISQMLSAAPPGEESKHAKTLLDAVVLCAEMVDDARSQLKRSKKGSRQ
jgi:hypothetical protein